MVLHNRHKKLFVGEKNTAGKGIIETNINHVVGNIPLGAESLDLALIQ